MTTILTAAPPPPPGQWRQTASSRCYCRGTACGQIDCHQESSTLHGTRGWAPSSCGGWLSSNGRSASPCLQSRDTRGLEIVTHTHCGDTFSILITWNAGIWVGCWGKYQNTHSYLDDGILVRPHVYQLGEHAVGTATVDLTQTAKHWQLCISHSHVILGWVCAWGMGRGGCKGQSSSLVTHTNTSLNPRSPISYVRTFVKSWMVGKWHVNKDLPFLILKVRHSATNVGVNCTWGGGE